MSPGSTLAERYHAARQDRHLVVLEGFHALKHALRFGARVVDARSRDPEQVAALAAELAPDVADRTVDLVQPIDPDTFDELTPAPHPTGVVAIARRPAHDLAAVLAANGAPLVLLERPTHHGNIGAAIRVAAAAGAAGVLVTGPHDPWHPASVRGGAGLQFALPVLSLEPDGATPVMESPRPLVVLDPGGEPLDVPAALPDGAVLVFGSERSGVSAELLDRADRIVSLPMRPGVSSLNLATAVAATLYRVATEP